MQLLRGVFTIFIPENILSPIAVAIGTTQVSKADMPMDNKDFFYLHHSF
jgi:hypothetical protein